MAYHFNERALIREFANDNPDVQELKFIREDSTGIKITSLTGGTVNYMFRVQSQDEKHSVVIKYGEENLRLFPEDKLSLDRQVLEYDSLVLLNSVLPGSAPRPYCLDRRHNVLAIEDLSHMTLLGDDLKRGKVHLGLAKNIGKTLALIHQGTSKENVSPSVWQEWLQKFGQVRPIEEYNTFQIKSVFFEDSSTVAFTPKSLDIFRKCMKLLEPTGFINKVSELFTTPTCFIHADCHWESMFVKDTEVKVFDLEFAFLSRPTMQLGWVIGSYPPCMLQACGDPGVVKTDLILKNKQAVHDAVRGYLEESESLRDEDKRSEFIAEVALFAGHAELSLQVILLMWNANWETITAMVTNTEEDKIWLTESGTRLMLNHENIKTVDELVDVMFADL